MIHWLWLLLAFVCGGLVGVGVMCLMHIARDSDIVINQFRSQDGKEKEKNHVGR